MKLRLPIALFTGLLFALGGQTVLAQGNSNVAVLAAKQQHNQMLPDQYDAWKRSATRGTEIGDNILLQSSTAAGFTTHTVQLGYNLPSDTDAAAFEAKLLAQPGVSSVSADHTNNQVTLIVKEEDEHDALKAYFDIE